MGRQVGNDIIFWMPVASKLQEAQSSPLGGLGTLFWEGGLRAESPGLASGSVGTPEGPWGSSVINHRWAFPLSLGILGFS